MYIDIRNIDVYIQFSPFVRTTNLATKLKNKIATAVSFIGAKDQETFK